MSLTSRWASSSLWQESQWQRLGQDPSALWRGVLLDPASHYDDLNELETNFVEAGRAADRSEAVDAPAADGCRVATHGDQVPPIVCFEEVEALQVPALVLDRGSV